MKRFSAICVVPALWALLWSPAALWAQVDMAKPAVRAVVQQQQVPDVRVIIDISGSMKKNDPKNLRRPALELLMRLFPAGTKAGVWTFGQWVNMLVPHRVVDEQWRNTALEKAKSINSIAMRTNIAGALERAVDDINNIDPNFKTHIILLTDGMVDIAASAEENSDSRQRIIDELLPALAAAGVTIHTVSLSNNADIALMERLAVETNGLSAVAETADDLTRVFLQAFDAAAPAEQLPLADNTFLVDTSIDEFTALVFRREGSPSAILQSPSGERFSEDSHPPSVKWHRQDRYDLITVEGPASGEWTLVAELEPDSRVTIVSNLSLQVNTLPKSVFIGTETTLTAALKDQGDTITKASFLSLVDMSVSASRREDGMDWELSLSAQDPTPRRGIFSHPLTMLNEPGSYDIVLHAGGPTFARQYKQTVSVYRPFEVSSSSDGNAVPQHTVTVFAKNPAVDSGNTELSLQLTLPDGSMTESAAQQSGDRRWTATLASSEQSGEHHVVAVVKGQYKNGEPIAYQSPALHIEHLVVGSQPLPKPDPEMAIDVVAPNPQAPNVVAEPPAEPPVSAQLEKPSDSTSPMIVYGGIALANILLIMLGYFAYKMVTSGAKDDGDDKEFEGSVTGGLSEDQTLVDSGSAPEVTAAQSELALETEPVADLDLDLDLEDLLGDEKAIEALVEELSAVDELNVDELDLDIGDTDDLEIEDQDLTDVDDVDGILDLPDDAIDIDPGAGDSGEKK